MFGIISGDTHKKCVSYKRHDFRRKDWIMEQLLQVGILSSTHGVHGEMKIFPTTDDPGRYKKLKKVFLDTGAGMNELKIESVKFFKKFVIVKFEGYDSINDIEKYKGRSIFVSREDAVRLGRNEYFVADLIGMRVVDENGNELGELTDVMETGANDVYVIRLMNGGELLLPAIKQCILSVDVNEAVMKVHVLDGLMD